ncbi:MAG: exo-beta-N-acetylmuramidase NamZ domain-containing protein, partial [Clostridia bacterium]
IPVYSLYGKTKQPTSDMLKDIDVLLFDLQDIGARTYTYISTLHACMQAAKLAGKTVIVLDRPNPLGGTIVEGPVAEDPYLSFIGVDNLPMAHGMTVGELARFFNRKIGVDLVVVPMEGYTRSMIFSDTGLSWVPSSPRIPDLKAVFGYMATGLGEGTDIVQADNFSWIGGKGIDSQTFANMLNFSNLPGVVFTPETRDAAGGVRLNIYDPRQFHPAKTGIYALTYAQSLSGAPLPKSGKTPAMFDLVMGTDKIGHYLEQSMSPEQILAQLEAPLAAFQKVRQNHLIYGDEPYQATAPIIYHAVSPTVPAKPTQPGGTGQKDTAKPTTPPAGTGKPATPAPATPAPAPAGKVPIQQSVPNGKVAYLTFDDGPSPVTINILDILKKENVKATFFVVGRSVKGNEKIVKRAIAEGHVVGGHSYSHNYKTMYKSTAAFMQDLELGNKVIAAATGVQPKIFRYPGGSTNTVSYKYQDPAQYSKQKPVMAEIKKEAAKRGYYFVDWNVSNGDAQSNSYTAASAVQRVKEQIHKKQQVIILMHDSAPKQATAQALPGIIKILKEQGYRFETLRPEVLTVSHVK